MKSISFIVISIFFISFLIIFFLLHNEVYFENKIYKSLLQKYERSNEISNALLKVIDEKKVYDLIEKFKDTKQKDGFSEALNSPINLLNEIENKRLKDGFILTKDNKRLNYFVHKFSEINKKILGSDNERPFASIDFIDDKIIIVTGLGKILISEKLSEKNLERNIKKIKFREIKNNLSNFEIDSKWNYERNFVKDSLIDGNDLYLFISHKEVKNDGDYFTYKIFKSYFSEKNLIFEEFFFAKKDLRPEGDLLHAAGRIINYDSKNLLVTSPDFGYPNLAQDKKSLFGKILKINKITGNYEIFSSGHRNPQGLFYDKNKDIILSTEHGPDGGDEINIIKEGKNYGWPITSYGTGRDTIKASNHSKYGFEEPSFHFNFVNCGMSDLIKIPKGLISEDENTYLLSCLSGGGLRYGKSLYHLNLKNEKLIKLDKIFINDRIRDIKLYKNKLIVLVLENSQSLGFIY